MDNLRSSPACEKYLLEILVEGESLSQSSQKHLSSCPDCYRQLLGFNQQVNAAREFLAPSSLQIQRMRANLRDKIERQADRGFRWQPAWTSALVLGCFLLLTFMLPYRFPPVDQVVVAGPSLYARAENLEVMADYLLPGTKASDPPWISMLSNGISEDEDMEQIHDLLDFVVPEAGEQT